MGKDKRTAQTILEAVGYGFFGTVFVLIVELTKSILTPECPSDLLSCSSMRREIALGGVLTGAVFSVIFVDFLLGKILKSEFTRWFLILLNTSITAILLQTAIIISANNLTFQQITSRYFGRMGELLGYDLMIELFLILTPFTILFANRQTIIEKIKNKSSLK